MNYLTNVTKALLGVTMASFVTIAALRVPSTDTPAPQRALDPPTRAAILEAYGRLPLSFEANQGQTDDQVKFLARGSGYNLFLTPTEAVLTLRQAAATEPGNTSERVSVADVVEKDRPIEYAVLRLQLVQANPAPQVVGLDQLPGKLNYFLGNDPDEWRTDIPTYAKVAYQEVYPGVDLIYYGNQGQLEYDFVVAPGADPGGIALRFAGADSLTVDAEGDLVLRTAGGEIRQQRPLVYQELGDVRQEIAGRYVLKGQGQVGIEVDAHDPSRPLVIDPVLVYSTYLGGSNFELGRGIAVDIAGNAYVTGQTDSTNFPISVGAFDTTSNGGDAFVTKLNPAGTALVYSTYLGGSNFDLGLDIAVDIAGNAYVTGNTGSTDLPTTAGAFDTIYNGGGDAFVTKLNPTGSALVYSTYLGGSQNDGSTGIAVDIAGNAYVTGGTDSTNFPTTLGAFDTSFNGGNDAYITKLNPAGSAPLVYSTYLGGNGVDEAGQSIAVDIAGNAYVIGLTPSTNFPTTAGAFDTSYNGNTDAFVTKLNPAGSALVYSTYLGGSDSELGRGIAVDSAGNAYVTGQTPSTNFPTTAGAFDTIFNGGNIDAFVTKLNPAGSALVYSTYLGGSVSDAGQSIALDSADNAYVTGNTGSANFPTTASAFDTSYNGGNNDVFVTKLNPAGSALVYSTYLGGSGGGFSIEAGFGIAVDSAGNAYVTGQTPSTDFPTTAGAFDTSHNGNTDAFVAKLSDVPVPAMLMLAPATATNPVGTQHCVTATVTDAGGNPTPGITVRFSVTGAVTTSGSATTDANGQAQFCYTGPAAPGADTITAYADTDDDNVQDPGEPFGTATKIWITRTTSTSVSCMPGTLQAGGSTTCTATVNDTDSNPKSTPTGIVSWTSSGAGTFSPAICTLMPTANPGESSCAVSYSSTQAGTHTITATYGGSTTHSGSSGTTTVTVTTGPPTIVTVDPPAATNQIDTQHCVTATVTDQFGNPTPSVTVLFSVTGSNSASGSGTTNTSGETPPFCYTGLLFGVDIITAVADANASGTPDPGEPTGTATKIWTLPASTDLCEVKVTQGGRITADNGDRATFGGNAKADADGNVSGQEEYQDHGPAQPMNVHSINVLAVTCNADRTQASVFGEATIDGAGSFPYRIQVEDLGEPGVGSDTYWIILSNGYSSGKHTLEGGNVQIHITE